MPHLHLSVQAGDDLILKRMRRRHLRDDVLALAEDVRRLRPDIVFGADLIAGFPTESEAMFQQSLDLVEASGLTWLHVFPYSPRRGTPAARMPQVPRQEIKERAARLRALAARRVDAYLRSLVGHEMEVLVESEGRGRTPHFAEVRLEPPAGPGEILRVRLEAFENERLLGARLG